MGAPSRSRAGPALALTLLACAAPPETGDGSAGVVSSASPEATRAGVEVLEAGGNAVDAAIATAFALGVTEPAGSGLAGQAFFLIHAPHDAPVVIRGSTRAPAAVPMDAGPDDLVGRRASTVPSLVAVMDVAWRRFGSGRIPWAELVEPAAGFAERGFTMGPFRHGALVQHADALHEDPAARAALLGDLGLPVAGRVVRQPALARTLRLLARTGAEGFYRGEIARIIDADMAAHGGWITYQDLAAFPAPEVVAAIRGSYRGHDVYTLPPPAGGWVVLLGLNLLERIPPSMAGSVPGTVWLAESLRAAHGMRLDEPVNDLDAYEAAVYRRIDKSRAVEMAHRLEPPGSGETTHLSVVDAQGMVVSATLSLNAYFGTRVMCPELGMLYNDYMREFVAGDPQHPFALAPGAMPYSSMSAAVLARDGEPLLALGSPGSRRIISAVIQVIHNWTDRRMPIAQAVAAPRVHVVPEDGEARFELPPAVPELVVELERRGLSVSPRGAVGDPLDPYFGGVHAVARQGSAWTGAADPRRDGAVGFARARSRRR